MTHNGESVKLGTAGQLEPSTQAERENEAPIQAERERARAPDPRPRGAPPHQEEPLPLREEASEVGGGGGLEPPFGVESGVGPPPGGGGVWISEVLPRELSTILEERGGLGPPEGGLEGVGPPGGGGAAGVSRETTDWERGQLGPRLRRDVLTGRKDLEGVFVRELGHPALAASTRSHILAQTGPRVEDVVRMILEEPGIKSERRVELYLQLVRMGLVEDFERPVKKEWRPGQPTKAGGRSFKVLGGTE